MIDLATLFQAASEEHAAAAVPGFPVSWKANPEHQGIDDKDISGVSGVSGPSEFPEQSEKFYKPQARAGGRAGERARGSYVGEPEISETPEKRVPAGGYLSGSLSLKPEKKRETGKGAPLPAPPVGIAPPTFDERAAFLEYECGLSRAEAEAQARAEGDNNVTTLSPFTAARVASTGGGLVVWRGGLARLDYDTAPCPGYRSDEWRITLARAVAFLDQFGAQADAFGWTASRLFGVHETAGIVRPDACGALVLPVGGEVRAITATEIRFSHLTHRQKPGQSAGVPWWEWRR